MNINIKYNPSYALAVVSLNADEQIKAEGGAMVSKSVNVSIETKKASSSGIMKSAKIAFFGGTSFWLNTFTAQGSRGEVTLAPTLPGDIKKLDIAGTVFVQSSSFLAASPSLEINTKFQGLKGFFSGESLFFLQISGDGPLLIASYGGIEELTVSESLIVDTGHIVAFQDSLTYRIEKLGNWKSFFLGGEGLVCHFTGSGKIWVQSRNVSSLTSWLREKLPPKRE